MEELVWLFFWNSTQCFSISSRDKMGKYTYLSGFITIHVYMIHLLQDTNSWWFFELQLWSELLENKVKRWFLVLWLKTLVWFQYRSAKIFTTRDAIHEALIIDFIYKWNKVLFNTKSKFVLKKKKYDCYLNLPHCNAILWWLFLEICFQEIVSSHNGI